MADSQRSDFFCCDASLQADEQLFATATRVDVWFALEYNGVFGADAFAEADLPAAVKEHVSAALKHIPRARMQLIRSDWPHAGLLFYVAVGHEHHPRLYRFVLNNYADLLSLDLVSIAAEDADYASNLTTQPLYLICTNGKKDRACARFGLPVYKAVVEYAESGGVSSTVWQTSHIGGHRFAGTTVFLPHGISYGRLDPESARQVVDAHRRGTIALEFYRGRCGYDEPVQAAEYFLRRLYEITLLSGLRFLDVETLDKTTWRVRFGSRGNMLVISVRQDAEGVMTYKSSTDNAPSRVPQFYLAEG